MKVWLFSLLAVFLPLCLSAQELPKELKEMGFTEEALIKYSRQGNKEFFTLFDHRPESQEDIVLFVVEEGQIAEEKFVTFKYEDQFIKPIDKMRKKLNNFKEELLKEESPPSYSDIMGK